jgi:hypothetical protein
VEEVEVDLVRSTFDIKHHAALLGRVSEIPPAGTVHCLAHRKDRAKASLRLAEHSNPPFISHTWPKPDPLSLR